MAFEQCSEHDEIRRDASSLHSPSHAQSARQIARRDVSIDQRGECAAWAVALPCRLMQRRRALRVELLRCGSIGDLARELLKRDIGERGGSDAMDGQAE